MGFIPEATGGLVFRLHPRELDDLASGDDTGRCRPLSFGSPDEYSVADGYPVGQMPLPNRPGDCGSRAEVTVKVKAVGVLLKDPDVNAGLDPRKSTGQDPARMRI